MKTPTPALILVLICALAACDLPNQAEGRLSDGTAIQGHRVIGKGQVEEVSFAAADGLACRGVVQLAAMKAEGRSSKSFPLSCSRGITGTAYVARTHVQPTTGAPGEVFYIFKLSNGARGLFKLRG